MKKRRARPILWVVFPIAAYLAGQSLVALRWGHGVTFRRVAEWRAFGPYRLLAPTAVAAGPEGTVIVSDRDANRVYLIDTHGRLIASAGGVGQAPGQFRLPLGVATDSQGQIYVADCDNHRIEVFDRRLRYLRTIEPDLPRPGGILPDGQGGLWVSAGEFAGAPYPLCHVDRAGRVAGSVGPPVAGFPSRDRQGLIWVTDRMGSRGPMAVRPDGTVAARLRRQGLKIIEDTVAHDGMLIVGDRGACGLLALDRKGNVLGAAPASELKMPDGFEYGPYGLAFDRGGYLWACFLDAGVVARYQVVRQ